MSETGNSGRFPTFHEAGGWQHPPALFCLKIAGNVPISTVEIQETVMLEPPNPIDETQRLMSLHSLRVLDTPSEERFDRITRMAQRMFGVEICLVSLVDENRQWFKSKQGLDACETSREISFCGHAILGDDLFIVDDASVDPRFADNPLVTGGPEIRFYAGYPIHGPHGFRIGTLCLIDSKPKTLTEDEKQTLRDLGGLVEDEMKTLSQSTVDDLTQIANRRGFNTVASHMLPLCERTGTDVELVFFDLDGFKEVNDELGHKSGDEILTHFGRLLMKCFRSADVVARLGGDEFVVLVAGDQLCSDAALKRLNKMALEHQCAVKSRLAWSVGRIKFDPARHGSVESMLAEADKKMYEDKEQRRKTGS
ncbi:MAG: diguanylate cyclase [Gammaproteobacteria bacterium]